VFGFFILVLALHPKFLRNAKPFQEQPFPFFKISNHHLLPFPFLELVPQLLLLVLLELLQLIQKIHLPLLVGFYVLNAHAIGLFGVLLFHVFPLDLSEHGILLNK